MGIQRLTGLTAILLCLMLLKASVGHAAECSPPQYIEAGTTALCSGWVHSTQATSNCLGWQIDLKACRSESVKNVTLLEAKLSSTKVLLKDEREAHAATMTLLDKQKAIIIPTTPFYQEPWFVATCTIIITAVIVVPVTWMAVTESGK